MNREILFRGKREDGTWAEGCYVFNGEIHGIVDNRAFPGSWSEVDPSTVGQYTGLTDKKGVKIFEGDIMKWSKNVEVVLSKGMFGARLPSTNYPNSMISLEKLEIVGNLFDNPELIK